jgi:leucyl/phenylalanyl-tRNA--protein transferase
MIPWLATDSPFPSLDSALSEPNGLLCAGGDLSPTRLINAYRHGIFPWFGPADPLLWWSPDPRMVLFPDELKISRSLRKTLHHGGYEVRLDSAFDQVIAACSSTPRPGQDGTWIVPAIRRAYGALHELGVAHSVETWAEGDAGQVLVGGLYGIAIGRMFYGESMFAHRTDASKIALAHLVRFLEKRGFGMIDCQMNTGHLASLGAREIPRKTFIERLHQLTAATDPLYAPAHWPTDAARREWN